MSDTNEPSSEADDRIHVALCVDRGFVVPLASTLSSINVSASSARVDIHVIHSGIDNEMRQRLRKGSENLTVVWHEVDDGSVSGLHNTDFLSSAALYRLILGDILPRSVRRVIYLDADTIVIGNLAELYGCELSGSTLGAVRDAVSPWASGVYGADWRSLSLDPGSPYFNSGVLLIDLDLWRADRAGEKCVDLLRASDARWGDQDALNVVFEREWTELPRRWNVQTGDVLRDSFSWALWRSEIESAVMDPGIIHYTSREKPWIPGSQHPESDRWFDALDRTSWSGWRPAGSVREHRGLRLRAAKVLRAIRRRRLERRNRLPG